MVRDTAVLDELEAEVLKNETNYGCVVKTRRFDRDFCFKFIYFVYLLLLKTVFMFCLFVVVVFGGGSFYHVPAITLVFDF